MTITTIDVEIPGEYDLDHNDGKGARLFENVTSITSPASGKWTRLDGKHLRWTGNASLMTGAAAAWAASVNVTTDASQSTASEGSGSFGAKTTLRFANGYTATSTTQGAVREFPASSSPPRASRAARTGTRGPRT
jgi:hypothetical protein